MANQNAINAPTSSSGWTSFTTTITATTANLSMNGGQGDVSYGSNNTTNPIVTIEVTGAGTGLWTIAQNASQNIRYGNQVTTTGIDGLLGSQAQGDGVTLVCVVANTTWQVVDSIGNLMVV